MLLNAPISRDVVTRIPTNYAKCWGLMGDVTGSLEFQPVSRHPCALRPAALHLRQHPAPGDHHSPASRCWTCSDATHEWDQAVFHFPFCVWVSSLNITSLETLLSRCREWLQVKLTRESGRRNKKIKRRRKEPEVHDRDVETYRKDGCEWVLGGTTTRRSFADMFKARMRRLEGTFPVLGEGDIVLCSY